MECNVKLNYTNNNLQIEILTVSLDLSCLDIANSLFTRAFLTINTALELMQNYEKNGDIEINNDNNKLNQLLSLLYELKGIENMFRRDDKGALTALKKSIQYDSNNLEANLVLCILHLELVQIKEVRTFVLTYFTKYCIYLFDHVTVN